MRDYKAIMRTARLTNKTRDEIDRGHGSATPAEVGPDELLRVAMTAIATGINIEDWNCVAEGLAMLEELHPTIDTRHRSYSVNIG